MLGHPFSWNIPIRQKQSSEEKKKTVFIWKCQLVTLIIYKYIYTMDHPKFNVSNQKEEFICA